MWKKEQKEADNGAEDGTQGKWDDQGECHHEKYISGIREFKKYHFEIVVERQGDQQGGIIGWFIGKQTQSGKFSEARWYIIDRPHQEPGGGNEKKETGDQYEYKIYLEQPPEDHPEWLGNLQKPDSGQNKDENGEKQEPGFEIIIGVYSL